jgi:hypothetical protein
MTEDFRITLKVFQTWIRHFYLDFTKFDLKMVKTLVILNIMINSASIIYLKLLGLKTLRLTIIQANASISMISNI